MKSLALTVALFTAVSVIPATTHALTLQVDASGGETYLRIQDAIDAASEGDTVLVHPGTYSGEGNRDLNFHGANLVLIGVAGPDSTILDCEEQGRAFVFSTYESEASVVAGFTIMNGATAGSGGAIYCQDSKPTLVDLKLVDNTAEGAGGGIAIGLSRPEHMRFSSIEFEGNSSDGPGGGLYCRRVSPTMVEMSFGGNSSGSSGGGCYLTEADSVMIHDSTFRDNSASSGAGAMVEGAWIVDISSIVMHHNLASNDGGGLGLFAVSSSDISNVTISRNSARRGGALYCMGASPRVSNSILAFSSGGEGVYCGQQSEPEFSFCDVYGNAAGDSLCGADAGGNFSLNPLFCSEQEGDLRLCSDSPCLPGNGWADELVGALGEADCQCPECHVIRVPSDFPSIGEALVAASSCDTVLVSPGVYSEGNLRLPWGACLISTGGRDSTVIDAQGEGIALLIGSVRGNARETPPSRVEGLTLRGATDSAIRIAGASPVISHCLITDNGDYGIDIASGSPMIFDCVISDNEGVGLATWDGSPTISDAVVSHNGGGGIACGSGAPLIQGVVFFGNAGDGGMSLSNADPTIVNCTFCGNSASDGGGLNCRRSSPTLVNTIIAFSSAGGGVRCDLDSAPTFECCNVFGNVGGDSLCGTDVGGNISVDPLFCNWQSGNLYLCPESECLPDGNGCGVLIGALGEGDCSCPESSVLEVPLAYSTIAEALTSASWGDTVLVLPGTYYESGLSIPGGVSLIGRAGPDSTVIDVDGEGAGVVMGYLESEERQGSEAMIRGFTITGATDSAIKLRNCSPSISDCTLADNSAEYGGGILCTEGANPQISNVRFMGNAATHGGGGLACMYGSSPIVSGCVFFDNMAGDDAWGVGGAIYCSFYSSPEITACTLSGNSSARWGGGITLHMMSEARIANCIVAFSSGGKGIYCYNSEPEITCCDIYGNAGGDDLCGVDGGNNFSADPLFCDPLTGELHLSQSSPCLPDGNDCGEIIGALGESDCIPPECRVIRVPFDFPTIAEALAVAGSCDTVLVQPGTYLERDIRMPWGVALIGTGGPESTIIDAQQNGTGILIGYGTVGGRDSPPAVLRGFTITGATDSGIRISNCSPVIEDCSLTANSGDQGGGMQVYGGASVELVRVDFTNNMASEGGAVFVRSECGLSILESEITGNVAARIAGSVTGSRGGAICCGLESSLHLVDVVLADNRAEVGGAIYGEYLGSLSLERTVLTRNSADEEGGGLCLYSGRHGGSVASCSFVGNDAETGAGIYFETHSLSPEPLTVDCTILAFNGIGEPIACSSDSLVAVTSCDTYGNAQGDSLCGMGDGSNFSLNPLFCDELDGDLSLCPDSPCLPDNSPCGLLIGAVGAGDCACPESATIHVPSDYGTIGEALAGARSGDTVVVAPGRYAEFALDLPWGVALIAEGEPHSTVIDAEDQGTVIRIESAERTRPGAPPATLRGFTITGGSDSGIRIGSCDPVITECVIEGNRGQWGGGIFCESESSPLISNVTLAYNASEYYGGGIYCSGGSPQISNTIIAFSVGSDAIYGGEPTLTACDIFGNSAGDSVACVDGGGNFSQDPLFCDPADSDFRLCPSSPCLPWNAPEGTLVGALWAVNCSCHESRVLEVPGTYRRIADALQSARHGDVVLVGPGEYHESRLALPFGVTLRGERGPERTTIDAGGDSTVVMVGLTGRGDTSIGTIPTILEGFTITGGVSSGVHVKGSDLTMRNCNVTGNSATAGGGIRCTSANLALEDVTIADNHAERGGGLLAEASEVLMEDVAIRGNAAESSGGGLLATRRPYDTTWSRITMANSLVIDNQADGGAGMFCECDTVSLSGVVISGNVAESSAGGAYIRASYASLADVRFSGNSAGSHGGGMYLQATPLDVVRTSFRQNHAERFGGGAYLHSVSATFEDTEFSENDAGLQGGALICYYTIASMENVSVSRNTAPDGGGFNFYDVDATLEDCVFSENEGTYTGGALAYDHSTHLNLQNCTLSGNRARTGGGLFSRGSSTTISNSILAFCSSGGAIRYIQGYEPSLHHCCVFGNAGGDSLGSDPTAMIREDPVFCDAEAGDLTLHNSSPCLPENNVWSERIGALGLGCSWTGSEESPVAIDGVVKRADSEATISFYLNDPAAVSVDIYDLAGRHVRTIVDNEMLSPGPAQRPWDLRNTSGELVASGTYICVVEVGDQIVRRKIAVLKG